MGKKRTDAGSGERLASFLILLIGILSAGTTLFAQNRYPIRQETKGKEPLYGFINRKGETVIPPRYSQVQDFDSGYCAVQDPPSKHWGLIDTAGNWILKPQYAAILTPFYCGVGAVGTATPDSTLQYVNLKGEVIFQTPHIWVNLWNPETKRYEGVYPFHEGYAIYGKADSNFPQVYLMNTKGKFWQNKAFIDVQYIERDVWLMIDNPPDENRYFLRSSSQKTFKSAKEMGFLPVFPKYNNRYHYPYTRQEIINPVCKGLFIKDRDTSYFFIDTYKIINADEYFFEAHECLIAFGKQPDYPIWHRHPLAYYDLKNQRWIWRQREETSQRKDVSGTYIFLEKGKPIEILILKCPDRNTLEAEYYSTALQKKEPVQLSVKDYRPQDRAFLLKFQGFNTYYPCFLKDAGTLILNNPENKLQEFVRVK